MDDYQDLIKQGKYSEVLKLLENTKANKTKISDFPELDELLNIEKKYSLDKTQTDIIDNDDYSKILKENLEENLDKSMLMKTSRLQDEDSSFKDDEDLSIDYNQNRDKLLNKIHEANKFSVNSLLMQNEKLFNNFVSLNEGAQMELEDVLSSNYMNIVRKQLFPYKNYTLPFFDSIQEKVDINFYKTDITQQIKNFNYDQIITLIKVKEYNQIFPSPEEFRNFTEIENDSNILKNIDIDEILNNHNSYDIVLSNEKFIYNHKVSIRKKNIRKIINIEISDTCNTKDIEKNSQNNDFRRLLDNYISTKKAITSLIPDGFSKEFIVEALKSKYSNSVINKAKELTSISEFHLDYRKINFENNLISQISEIGKFEKLTDINLSFNQIKEIPSCFRNLIHLTILNLEKNKISKIENLQDCKKLRSLNLNKNQIDKIANISDNIYLERLLLAGNKIAKLENMDRNVNLLELNLSKNMLREVKYLSRLICLESLYLYKNYIEEIDDLSLPFLKELYLNNNKLAKFKSGCCFNLKDLFLHNNSLDKLESFKECSNLKTLDLSFNQINSFSNIVESLKSNMNISKFSIHENPFFKFVADDNVYKKILCKILPLKYFNYQEISNKTIIGFHNFKIVIRSKDIVQLSIENYFTLTDTFRNYFRKIINRIKEEYDEKKGSKGNDYSYLDDNYISLLNNNIQLSCLNNLIKNLDNLHNNKFESTVYSFNDIYFNLFRIFLSMRKYRLSKIVLIQRNFLIFRRKQKYKNTLIIRLQKHYRRFRVMKRIRKLKNIPIDDDEDLFNVDEMEKHFKQNFADEDYFEPINVEKFDLNKLIQESKIKYVNKTDSSNKINKVETIHEELPLKKKDITIKENNINSSEELKTVTLRNGVEATMKKSQIHSHVIDKNIDFKRKKDETIPLSKKDSDNIKLPTIQDKKLKQQQSQVFLEEDSKIRGKSLAILNNDIKLPSLNNNNFNYNIINNNSRISDISLLSEKSKISSHTNDSRTSKISNNSKKIINSKGNNKEVEQNKLK